MDDPLPPDSPPPQRPVYCCNDLETELRYDVLFSYNDHEPFNPTKSRPAVYVLSDGGHGGWAQINFCPFCGKKIELQSIVRQ